MECTVYKPRQDKSVGPDLFKYGMLVVPMVLLKLIKF